MSAIRDSVRLIPFIANSSDSNSGEGVFLETPTEGTSRITGVSVELEGDFGCNVSLLCRLPDGLPS